MFRNEQRMREEVCLQDAAFPRKLSFKYALLSNTLEFG